MNKVWLAILTFFMISSVSIGWADETINVGEVVVTASKIEEAVEETTSSVIVIKKNLTLFARIENLFNRHYEEAGGHGTKGASAYGGMRVTL